MGPIARFLNVFFSPGAVFEDIRRDPRGFMVPIVLCSIAVAAFVGLYFARYDLATVYREYLKESFGIKLAGLFGGAEVRDKALDQAILKITGTPMWQFELSAILNPLAGFVVTLWFFTFIYGLFAHVVGWLPGGTKGKPLFVNAGIVLGIGVVFAVIQAGLQIAVAVAAKAGGAGASSPAWVAIAQTILTLVALGATWWAMNRLAREPAYGRVIGAVSYGLAPSALAGLVGVIIVLVRTPDATWIEDVVPANLSLLFNLKETSPVLASLGASLGLFTLWSLALTVIGLAKVLGRSMSQSAVLVLAPWGIWVLVKLVFAAF
jgi:hypothetical protein